jgi:hypothetical protein
MTNEDEHAMNYQEHASMSNFSKTYKCTGTYSFFFSNSLVISRPMGMNMLRATERHKPEWNTQQTLQL